MQIITLHALARLSYRCWQQATRSERAVQREARQEPESSPEPGGQIDTRDT
jgi:hypothetical protein